MIFCLARAIAEGIPLLQSDYLSRLTNSRLSQVFSGNMPVPLLQERAATLRRIGSVLSQHYQESFLSFLRAGKPRLYNGQAGLLDRLTTAFTSFEDEASYRGHRIRFRKRAQLLMWQLHTHFRNRGLFRLEDPEKLTAFADYILPAALRVLGIISYSSRLEESIQQRRLLEKGGGQEVEIRAFTLWACHRLTRAHQPTPPLRPRHRHGRARQPALDPLSRRSLAPPPHPDHSLLAVALSTSASGSTATEVHSAGRHSTLSTFAVDKSFR